MAKRISWDSITGERVQVEAIKLLSECGCPETAQSKALQEKAFAKIVKDYSELLKVIGCIEGLSEVISVHRI